MNIEVMFAEKNSASEEYSVVQNVIESEELREEAVISKMETTIEVQKEDRREVINKVQEALELTMSLLAHKGLKGLTNGSIRA